MATLVCPMALMAVLPFPFGSSYGILRRGLFKGIKKSSMVIELNRENELACFQPLSLQMYRNSHKLGVGWNCRFVTYTHSSSWARLEWRQRLPITKWLEMTRRRRSGKK